MDLWGATKIQWIERSFISLNSIEERQYKMEKGLLPPFTNILRTVRKQLCCKQRSFFIKKVELESRIKNPPNQLLPGGRYRHFAVHKRNWRHRQDQSQTCPLLLTSPSEEENLEEGLSMWREDDLSFSSWV
jgi:hypothetical protein